MEKVRVVLFFTLGVLFILSGWMKLQPVELLELDLGYHLGIAENVSMVFARLLIGFEMALGVLLIMRFKERLILFVSGVVLVLFSFYLFYLIIQFPGQDNCGCMGMVMPMTPMQSLIKNTGLLALVVFLFVTRKEANHPVYFFFHRWFLALISLCFMLPFILNTIDWEKTEIRQSFDLSNQKNILDGLGFTNEPQALVAYLSPSCIYCKMFARKWEWFLRRNQWKTPIHVVFMGEGIDEDINKFFQETGMHPTTFLCMNAFEFVKRTNGSLPSVYLVKKGVVVQKDNFITFNEQNLKASFSH